MAPQGSQLCGGNFLKRKSRPENLCEKIRMVIIEIVITLLTVHSTLHMPLLPDLSYVKGYRVFQASSPASRREAAQNSKLPVFEKTERRNGQAV